MNVIDSKTALGNIPKLGQDHIYLGKKIRLTNFKSGQDKAPDSISTINWLIPLVVIGAFVTAKFFKNRKKQ